MIKLMAVSLFYWSLVLLWVMGVRFENFRSFWEIKCLQGYSKTL